MGTTPLASVRKLTQAWKRKDREGMSRYLVDNIVEIGPAFKPVLEGRADFLRSYETYFRSALQITSYRILRPRILALAPGLVMIYFHYWMTTAEDGRLAHSDGKESILVERHGRAWKVRFLHWHRD
jgi:Domain of unknown function (DUF4440)